MGPFQNLGARLPVAGTMAIVQVATISANDPTIGQLISSVTERVGREGVVTVEVADPHEPGRVR